MRVQRTPAYPRGVDGRRRRPGPATVTGWAGPGPAPSPAAAAGGPPPARAAAGVLLRLAFPPYGLWWLDPARRRRVTLLVRRRARRGRPRCTGFVCGVAFFLPAAALADRHRRRRLGAAGRSCEALFYRPCSGRHPGARLPRLAGLGRPPLGGGRGAARRRAVRRVPVGPAGVRRGATPLTVRTRRWAAAPLVTFAGRACAEPCSRPRSLRRAVGRRATGAAWSPLAGGARRRGAGRSPGAAAAGRDRRSRWRVVQGNVPRVGAGRRSASGAPVLDNHVDGDRRSWPPRSTPARRARTS